MCKERVSMNYAHWLLRCRRKGDCGTKEWERASWLWALVCSELRLAVRVAGLRPCELVLPCL